MKREFRAAGWMCRQKYNEGSTVDMRVPTQEQKDCLRVLTHRLTTVGKGGLAAHLSRVGNKSRVGAKWAIGWGREVLGDD